MSEDSHEIKNVYEPLMFENISEECTHRFFDGRSAIQNKQWTECGFVGVCMICQEVIE